MKTETNKFNQIPPQCEGICSLDQETVDKHGIVLALNCDGPSTKGDTYHDETTYQDGEVILVVKNVGQSVGRAACTNRGVWLWNQERKQAFLEGES